MTSARDQPMSTEPTIVPEPSSNKNGKRWVPPPPLYSNAQSDYCPAVVVVRSKPHPTGLYPLPRAHQPIRTRYQRQGAALRASPLSSPLRPR